MGTDSQQALAAFNQGLDMFKKFSGGEERDQARAAKDQARLLETDARADAYDAQRRARKESALVRAENERERSRERAGWGGSNIEMSGSKAVIRDARSVKDMQEEDDVLFEGQRNADSILRQARNRANMLRINGGASPNRSLLSMGSSIYRPGRQA